MSLFKKPKRNFRQRITRQDSDEENNNDDEKEKSPGIVEPAQMAISQDAVSKLVEKRKTVRSQPVAKPVLPCFATTIVTPSPTVVAAPSSVSPVASGTLSFENEEEGEGEVFKVKKSSYSRRLAKQLEKERKKKPANSDLTENSDVPVDVSNIKKEITDEENDIVLNGEQMEEMELGSADEEKEQDAVPDPFKRILESGSIPDAAMIHAARKRRQMAREMSDFVTIEDKETNENTNSRLVRDDDNDRSDDDDEEEGRMSFAVSSVPLAKDRAREALMALNQKDGNQGIDEEADEEIERWEQEQIRKGVSIPQVVPPQEAQGFSSYMYPEAVNMYPETSYSAAVASTVEGIKQEPEDSSTAIPMAAVTNNLPTFTLDGFKQHVHSRLESQRQVHRAHERERDKIMDDLVESESRILELEEQSPGVARAFTFYQEMRGYVTDLVECLDEKVVQITMLERSMMQLLKQRAANLVQRRQQDIKDQCEEFSNIFSKTGAPPVQNPFNPEKMASDAARARRAAEREGRRTRRRRARESRGTNINHFDGMSSDDEEMDTDTTQFKAERERLRGQAETVFEDVIDDFRNFNAIKRRFERWKEEYPESYKNAYIGLCLPKVFTPLVKLQLLSWNPLEETRDFEETRWFESLMFYSYHESQATSDLKGDSDTQLIPLIVERVILPKLKELAETVWDPMSTSQTLRFVSLMQKLLTEYPTVNGKSKKTQELLQAVANRMRKTLDDDVYMPPYPKAVLENKTLGANTFFQRQYWSSVKLLRNLLSWQGILSDGPLQELALDGLLNRYLLWAMHNSASNKDSLEKAKMVLYYRQDLSR